MGKAIYKLTGKEAREASKRAIDVAPEGYYCRIEEETRTLEQNALMWPLLREFSRQILLPVDGERIMLEEEAWKDVLTAVFCGEKLRMVKYFDGSLVLVGKSTSGMGKRKFADFLTFLLAEAVERGVDVSRKAKALQDTRDYIRANAKPAADLSGVRVPAGVRRAGDGESEEAQGGRGA